MKNRFVISVAAATAIGLPLFVGFTSAGPKGRGVSFLGGFFSLPSASAQTDDGPYQAYQEALKIIKDQYYAPEEFNRKKKKELTYAAIRGMLYSLNDPFTSFLDPDEWQQMQQTTRGDFDGIGAVLEPYGEDVRVARPIPGTPAYNAGVKAGDLVMSVEAADLKTGKLVKTSTLKKNINEVVKLIKGPAGSKVKLTLMRKGATTPIEVSLVRAHIEPPVVQSWMEDTENKIGHVVLNEFNEKSRDQLDKAIETLSGQGMKALVFDLRYNPGGLLTVAVDVGSRFIEDGPVVILQEKNGQRQGLNARTYRKHMTIPFVVLVNENSASASEIVSGAIKDKGTGKIIGEHTFGKGLVQTLLPLEDGSALRLTTAKYFTPNGNDINNKYDDEHRPMRNTGGVKPDIVVKQSPDWADQDFEDKKNDTQLQKALETLRAQLGVKVTNSPR